MGKRIIIVDFNPLVHQYIRGGAPQLSKTIVIDGVTRQIDTTIQNFTIKAMHRWANNGRNPLAVCFDSPCPSRKEYFKRLGLKDRSGNTTLYKEGRGKFSKNVLDCIEMTAGLLIQSGVSVYKCHNYEADDLVFACVQRAKEQYAPENRALEDFYTSKINELVQGADSLPLHNVVTKLIKSVINMNLDKGAVLSGMLKLFPNCNADLITKCIDIMFDMSIRESGENFIKEKLIAYPIIPIDIICNDVDYFPLVDDQVSVFYRTHKQTWAESKELEKKHYIQVIPDNIESVMRDISQYKNLYLPYNTVLLAKLLRGDKSDNIPPHPGYPPREFNKLTEALVYNGFDCDSIFRYGGEEQEKILSDVLNQAIDEDEYNFAMKVYRGINLNCAFTGLSPELDRKPAVISTDINTYSAGVMQKVLYPLGINIPV